MIKKIFGLFILVGLLLPVVANASTVNPAFEFTSNNTLTGTNYTFGVVFKPTANIWVDYLGYYDPPGGMGATSHQVAIFNSGGTDLTGIQTITSSSTYSTAHFLYNTITPIELLAGDTYVLDGFTSTINYGSVSNAQIGADGFTKYAPITILGDNDVHASFAYTGTATPFTTNYFGADFGYSETPEPSTLLLLGSGLAGLAGLIKRKLAR
jgi:hypothetical protein